MAKCPFFLVAYHAAHHTHQVETDFWIECRQDICELFQSGMVNIKNEKVSGMCCFRFLAIRNDKGQVLIEG
jgi:hypothetical protein